MVDASGRGPAAPRLALCGNVFRGDTPGDAVCALDGPFREVLDRLPHEEGSPPLDFGLYLSAAAAAEVVGDRAGLARMRALLKALGTRVWTANAFPFGGFHAGRVKDAAFLPDWRDPARLQFALDAAAVLVALMEPGRPGSVSTCPVGYGRDCLEGAAARDHLRRAQEALAELERDTGARLVLALEPEPDGAFETVPPLCEWLADEVLADLPAEDRRVGVCWDLCHSAVVGETPAAVLSALRQTGVPLGKVQVSAALRSDGAPTDEGYAVLGALAEDPYLHQVRGEARDGTPLRWADLPDMLEDAAVRAHSLRVHCHVPLHRPAFRGGLLGTDWRAGLEAARAAGVTDFEIETYTLPVLPQSFLDEAGVAGTLAAEAQACREALRPAALTARSRLSSDR